MTGVSVVSSSLRARSSNRRRTWNAGVIGEKAQASHNEESPEPLTNAQLAIFQEFGTETIPARPFVGESFRVHREQYRLLLQALIKDAIVTGKVSLVQALGLMGQKMAADMKAYITSQPADWAPMALSTYLQKVSLTRKGAFNDPKLLIDTGRLRASISYEVVGGSEGK